MAVPEGSVCKILKLKISIIYDDFERNLMTLLDNSEALKQARAHYLKGAHPSTAVFGVTHSKHMANSVPFKIFHDASEFFRSSDTFYFRNRYLDENVDEFESLEPAGFILHCNHSSQLSDLRQLNAPIVNTSGAKKELEAPTVTLDNEATGKLAAENLLRKGCAHFAAFGSTKKYFLGQRMKSFADAIRGMGRPVSSFLLEESDFRVFQENVDAFMKLRSLPSGQPDDSASLRDWILALPANTGLFFPEDHDAICFEGLCHELNIDAGKKFRLLSGHFRGMQVCPELSGIEQPESQWGIQAAQLLERLILGLEEDVNQRILLPPVRVIEKDPVYAFSSEDRFLDQALKIIREQATKGLTVRSLVEKLGTSRRSLERRFRERLNSTALDEIRRVQVEHAKRLLIETDITIYAVAHESGFPSDASLRRLFGKLEGMSPAQFRSANRG